MNPRDFLDVADEWAAGMREAEWRSAVSRAYFAAFHVARDLLSACGFAVPQGEQAHGYLWIRLQNTGHPDVKRAGSDLNYLRTMRNRADYDLKQPFPHALAFGQVQAADDIVQVLESVLTIPNTLTQITDAIKDYERNVLKQVTWHP